MWLRALGRREFRMGPCQLNRAEGKFFGEGHETLDPKCWSLLSLFLPGGLCPLVSHGHLQPPSSSKEHGLGPATHSSPQPPRAPHSLTQPSAL